MVFPNRTRRISHLGGIYGIDKSINVSVNSLKQPFQSLELRQVHDVLSCLLHSLLLHRTSAKVNYLLFSQSKKSNGGIVYVGGKAKNKRCLDV